jgi:hypothetical protein
VGFYLPPKATIEGEFLNIDDMGPRPTLLQ